MCGSRINLWSLSLKICTFVNCTEPLKTSARQGEGKKDLEGERGRRSGRRGGRRESGEGKSQ